MKKKWISILRSLGFQPETRPGAIKAVRYDGGHDYSIVPHTTKNGLEFTVVLYGETAEKYLNEIIEKQCQEKTR